MTQGIEVLQAALSGKRVRRHDDGDGITGTWHYWDGQRLLHLSGVWCNCPLSEIFTTNWEVQEPSALTFTEAVAAMDAGQTVTKGDGATKYRWEDTDYWYRTDGDHEWFPDAVFGWEEVHATDWRIVRDVPTDERPTRSELAMALWRVHGNAHRAADELIERWPAMVREEAN